MMFIGDISLLGGRGECKYCKEMHDNVSFHQEWECAKRPRATVPTIPEQKIPVTEVEQMPGTAGLQIKCNSCRNSITIPAALLFSPPDENSNVKKIHLCQECYELVCDVVGLQYD